MSEQTAIAWCDSTFNPWIGCTKVGPGCDNCYAERDFALRKKRVVWGAGQERRRTKTWGDPVKWNKRPFFACAECSNDCSWRGECDGESCPACGGHVVPARRRVFCASLADVFDNEVPEHWREDLFTLIRSTPHLDWLLLTKRIGNATAMIEAALSNMDIGYVIEFAAWPWPNVWLGATVVNQDEADRDIPKLLAVPAAKRFLSIEPMLGPINLERIEIGDHQHRLGTWCAPLTGTYTDSPLINWVIVGGESGPKARPFDIRWARNIVQQCKAANVPVFVKQLGEQPRGWCASRVHVSAQDNADLDDDYCDFYEAHEQGAPCPGRCGAMVDRKGGDPAEWPEDLRVREFPTIAGAAARQVRSLPAYDAPVHEVQRG